MAARLAAGARWSAERCRLGTSSVSPCSVPSTPQRLLLTESSLRILTLRGPPDVCPRPAWPLAPGQAPLRICALAQPRSPHFLPPPSHTAPGGSTSFPGLCRPSRNVNPTHGGRRSEVGGQRKASSAVGFGTK